MLSHFVLLVAPSVAVAQTFSFCLPVFTQRWSAITQQDASIGVHNLDGGIAIGGALTDPPAASVNPNPVPIAEPSWVNSFAAGTSVASYAFNSGVTVGQGINPPIDFSVLQGIASAATVGVTGPTDQSAPCVQG